MEVMTAVKWWWLLLFINGYLIDYDSWRQAAVAFLARRTQHLVLGEGTLQPNVETSIRPPSIRPGLDLSRRALFAVSNKSQLWVFQLSTSLSDSSSLVSTHPRRPPYRVSPDKVSIELRDSLREGAQPDRRHGLRILVSRPLPRGGEGVPADTSLRAVGGAGRCQKAYWLGFGDCTTSFSGF